MPTHMLQFTHIDQKIPEKRSAQNRKQDFREIYAAFDSETATQQASRCVQCGIPFCSLHCPLGNNIPDWLMLSANGRMKEAYQVSSATNPMPEICGRICPQDRLCEGFCVLEQSSHHSITIGALEKHITETAWKEGWVEPIRPLTERSESVGIIGGGPAGLAAAESLRSQGFQVHVYDRYDRFGGLLMYGIPGFKLEKPVVERRIHRLAEGGVVFHANANIGVTESFAALRNRHAAVLIATGVYKARRLTVPGVGLSGVHKALEYLIAANHADLGDSVTAYDTGMLNARDKNVVVIGGGDTAMDCVRTAVRQGARSVRCLYRRDRDNMPGSQREVGNAEEEGVEFIWMSAPEALIDEGNPGHVTAVRAVRMHLGVPDASGRQSPQPIKGSEYLLPADLVIEALGFEPEDIPRMFGEEKLVVTHRGTLKTDPQTLMTSLPGVFAAGDIVRGASLVVWAIHDGREASAALVRYLDARKSKLPVDAA